MDTATEAQPVALRAQTRSDGMAWLLNDNGDGWPVGEIGYNGADPALAVEIAHRWNVYAEFVGALTRFVEAAEASFGPDNGACGGVCNICTGRALLDRIQSRA